MDTHTDQFSELKLSDVSVYDRQLFRWRKKLPPELYFLPATQIAPGIAAI